MKFAVIVFPGSSGDIDLYEAIHTVMGQEVDYVDYRATNLEGYDAILIPGGLSYGNYLRPGAMASLAPVMEAVKEKARQGVPILGICNGFQILTEAGLLPGALLANPDLSFIHQPQAIVVENTQSIFSHLYEANETITLPIAHAEGSYYCDQETLAELQANKQIIFRYKADDNPSGGVSNIAGITNKAGNVLGMMPYPERAVEAILGFTDGLKLFKALIESIQTNAPVTSDN